MKWRRDVFDWTVTQLAWWFERNVEHAQSLDWHFGASWRHRIRSGCAMSSISVIPADRICDRGENWREQFPINEEI
jgi:hypothetical protein